MQYARALRFAGGLSPLERADLLERRAEECYLSAQIDAAVAAQREALECHRRLGDVMREGDALRVLSRTLFFVGRTAEGEAAGEKAVELLEQLPPGHELAVAYCNVSQRWMVVENGQEAQTWGARALELAERLGDPRHSSTRSRISEAPSCPPVSSRAETGSSGRSRWRNSTASRIMPDGSSTAW